MSTPIIPSPNESPDLIIVAFIYYVILHVVVFRSANSCYIQGQEANDFLASGLLTLAVKPPCTSPNEIFLTLPVLGFLT